MDEKKMTVEEAIRALLDEYQIGDYVYDVRSTALEEDPEYTGESWEHPTVKRFADVLDTLRRHIEK